MGYFDDIIKIFLSLVIYFIFTFSTSKIVKKTGGNLKEFKNRVTSNTLLIGAISNILILASILLLLKYYNRESINALAVKFNTKDLIFIAAVIFVLIDGSIIIAFWIKHKLKYDLKFHSPFKNNKELIGLVVVISVLLIVAIQEEILFRAYITLNLISLGVPVVVIISTVIFTLIHFPTNKINKYQVLGWLQSGFVFSLVYLITGTIWVPIILHFFIDSINVLFFNIVGKYSLITISHAVTDKYRIIYKAFISLIILALLFSIYGTQVRFY